MLNSGSARMLLPIEATAIDNGSAQGCTMATQKFRQRMNDNIGSMPDGAQ